MKQFLHKLRNVGAFVCACIVFLLVILDITLLGEIVVRRLPTVEAYEQIKIIWGGNLCTLLFAVLGNFLHVTDNDNKADIVAYSGLGGLTSFVVFGIAFLVSGLAAHQILVPILMFFVSIYICFGIYVFTRYFAHKLRGIPLVYEEEFEEDASEETVLSV